MKELTPAEQAELKFLRRQVDEGQDEMLRRDADASAPQHYQRAKRELTEFVSGLRAKGRHI